MPIKKVTNEQTGKDEFFCKSNAVDTTVDDWKPLPAGMLELNPNSDKPDLEKDQIIYFQQQPKGIMIVDADKLDPSSDVTMHEQSWRYKVLLLKNILLNNLPTTPIITKHKLNFSS